MTQETIRTVQTVSELRKAVGTWRSANRKVVLVPTMGALHEGHLSLVRLAKETGERVVVSIFVNPAQFAPNEDFDSYPRTFEDDLEQLAKLKVDLVFAPPRDEVYPDDFSTHVTVAGLSEGLCGASRPHFFGGVATVVAKLLNQCRPDVAIFGEKDYQQLLVIRRMARDLDTGAEVVGGPIVRESDGLAMSSRNAYLTPDERKHAPELYGTLKDIAAGLATGAMVAPLLEKGRERLSGAGFDVDYLEVRNADTLQPIEGHVREPARVFGAAMLGKTRLIDNVAVPGSGVQARAI
ncbi:MAG: pantoate--beta-alanine ligase [Hyphomicrobiaceae bacterium]|nr:pantoate--beta-alanine ligase [Hyphomicrobiaceae bacterium]